MIYPKIRFSIAKKILFCLSIIFLPMTALAQGDSDKRFDTFTVYWENDAFVNTDRDYTNGLKLTWSTPFAADQAGSDFPGWSYPILTRLPFLNNPELKRAVSFSIGQNIYTPGDTARRDLIPDDRPYAGYTYLAAGFHGKSSSRKHTWEISLGIVGPHSYAQEVQNWAHDLIGSPHANGWDNQLNDEIGLNMTFETQWRLFHTDIGHGLGFDVIPHIGGSLGNVNISLNAGGEARFGWNLPKNFGTCPIRSGCENSSTIFYENQTGFLKDNPVGFHLFTAVDGRAVLRDIFLDGNSFEESHHVDKEPLVADLVAGFSFEYHYFKLSYSYVYRTKQFKTQNREQIFGAINVSFSY